MGDDGLMTGRRAVLAVTFLLLTGMGGILATMTWQQAGQWASVASGMAGLAAVGVAIWAALPGSKFGARASRTGTATVRGLGMANTGIMGPASNLAEPAVAEHTGAAEVGEGEANTAIRRL